MSQNQYNHFLDIIKINELQQLNQLIELAPEQVKTMILANKCAAFHMAAINGHLLILNRLIELIPSKVLDIIKEYNFSTFRETAYHGHLAILNRLIDLTPNLIQAMIAAQDFFAFRIAAANGHLSILNRLIELSSSAQVRNMLTANCYSAFIEAARNGHLLILNRLIELSPELVEPMIEAKNFSIFRGAVVHGHLLIVNRLIELRPEKLDEMLKVNHFTTFREAASHGHLPIFNRLIELASTEQIQAMIEAKNFSAFRDAARNDHFSIVERLIALSPHQVARMISADDFDVFRWASKKANILFIKRLIELVPELIEDMVAADKFSAFRDAAFRGQLDILNYLIELAPKHLDSMIAANHYSAFRWAAFNSHFPILERLIHLAPEHLDSMIASEEFTAFRVAAGEGNLQVLSLLIDLAPKLVQEMIASKNFDAFREAAFNGHLPIINHLIELAPAQVQDMIAALDDFSACNAFYTAISHDHLPLLQQLIKYAPRIEKLIEAEGFYAFRLATSGKHISVINYFLAYSNVFAYAEIHMHKYGILISSFITSTLDHIRHQKESLMSTSADAVLDLIDTDNSKLYFYMMRHLIRQNNATALTQLQFLAEIPSIRNLAHKTITPDKPNELLRLAMQMGNHDATRILLAITDVQLLAQSHDYYPEEQAHGIDLRALAKDHESSINALTRNEECRLNAALKYYQPKIAEHGIDQIIQTLRKILIQRYQARPATITTQDEKDIKLPVDWTIFQALDLSADSKAQALKAYYQHPDHTAYRYISKPNPWIDAQAPFAIADEQGAYSSFEAYLPLIALQFLAAIDEDFPASEGYTIDSRFELFIHELASIGRAHNWDSSRMNPRTGQIEAFDDLEADNPSCFSGGKRRLFQSVQGHALFNILNTDIINQEQRDFVRAHFMATITDQNCQALLGAWTEICELGYSTNTALDELDIPLTKQMQFIETLREKYQDQFDADPIFYLRIQHGFMKSTTFTNHASKFGGEIDLLELLEQKVKSLAAHQVSTDKTTAQGFQFFQALQTQHTDTAKISPSLS
ncbi:MAG: hypothetical protein EBY16_01900 [Gammaproteobacteria bacterium]|nr:hypothetical protein [Gammaproteobacteria bacterium]